MTDKTALGDEYRSHDTSDVGSEVIVVRSKEVAVSVSNLEIVGDRGPIVIDGQKVRHVTGIKLEWSVDSPVWRAEITKLILP